MKISNALKIFLLDCEKRGLSYKTLLNYNQQINYFIIFLSDLNIKSITNNTIENYIIFLRNKYVINNNLVKNKLLSTYSIKSYLTGLKAFLNFCYHKNYIKKKLDIPTYKVKKNNIIILSTNQINSILDYYISKNDYKNLLIISLFLDCGLRLSEVVGLDFENFNFDLNLIRVVGKGNKVRFVPLTDFVFNYFKIYCKFFNIYSGALFKYNNTRLKASAVSSSIRRLKKNLKFDKLHPHYFRHTFATLFLINGGNAIFLKEILGHSSYKMVENYIHISNQFIISKQSKYSPLSNIKKG